MPGLLRRVAITETAPVSGTFWRDTKSLIDRQAVTPIVGSFMTAALVGADLADVAESWAGDESVLAPNECRDLARVAQFYSVRQKARRETKNAYLDVLREALLAKAEEDPALDAQLREDLYTDKARFMQMTVSEFARCLGYPRFARPEENPLRLLAELPLPLYITTSHHDLLEHALANTRPKPPVSEILYWDQALENIPSIYDAEPDYKPSVDRPLVYHISGRDAFPESLVLTEDDYLDCLIKLSELRGQVNVSSPQARARTIPNQVRTSLSTHALLLLGYRVNDWEFRMLFRGLILGMGGGRTSNTNVPRGIFMQMDPADGADELRQRIKEHFKTYFERSQFDVYWGDELTCVNALTRLCKGGV